MKSIVYHIALIGLLTLSVVSCKNNTSKHQAIETEHIQFTKEGELTFFAADSTELMNVNIELAQTDYEMQTGLMYRKSMAENQGMLFVYPNERPRPYFYMKNTYIGLDLIYISADYKVVDINENAQPLDETTIPSTAPAKYVLEVNDGMAQKWGLKIGDFVNIKTK